MESSTTTPPGTSVPGQALRRRPPDLTTAEFEALNESRTRRRQLPLATIGVALITVLLVLVSLLLRLRTIHFHFWIDEGLSVGISSHHLSQIPTVLRQDGSPPLYYLLLHVWMSVFGRGVVATHALSLVFALVTIPVSYWAGSSLFDRRTGLVATLIAATLPYLSTYGVETRMYALMALLSLIVATSFVHVFVFRRRRYLPVFSLSMAAALYTHNWALFLGLMTAVAFVVCWREALPEDRRALLRDGLIGFGAVAILFAPWLPTLLYQAGHTGAPWDTPPDIWSLTQGAYSLVNGRGEAVALLIGGGAGLLALRAVAGPRDRIRLAVTCLLVLAVGTLLTAWAYSKVTPAWADRYLAAIVGPLLVVFSLGLTRAGRLGLVALALCVAFWVTDPVASSLNSKSNVATVVAALRPELSAPTLVLSPQPEQVPTIAYYLPSAQRFVTPLGPVADRGVTDWRDALAKLEHTSFRKVVAPALRGLAPGDRVLLISPTHLPSTPTWLHLIDRDARLWLRALERDPALVKVGASSAGGSIADLLPVAGYVFAVR